MVLLFPMRKKRHGRQEREEIETYLSVQLGPFPGARGEGEGGIKEKQ